MPFRHLIMSPKGALVALSATALVTVAGITSGGIKLNSGGVKVLGVTVVKTPSPSANSKPSTTTTSGPDNTAPPTAPTIVSKPDNPTSATTAQFTFTDSDAGVSFECALDKAKFANCATGQSYTGLKPAGHKFVVRAIGSTGKASLDTTWDWTIVKNIDFPISGDASGSLSPGVEVPVNLTFTNPYNFAIQINDVSITIDNPTATTACQSSQNLEISKPFVGPVTVEADATMTLTDSRRPNIRLRDLPTKQDACKGLSFQLHYIGTAIKP
jgi:hypothetical protein